jgi:hypothetical protein
MRLIEQYRSFRRNLQGYLEVTFDEFRNTLLPLKKRREWSEADTAYVKELADIGGGHALQLLFGERHAAAAKLLGEKTIDAEEFTREALDEHMAALVKSCKIDCWPAQRYRSYLKYLDSAMTPAELEEMARAQSHAASLVQDARALAGTRAPADEKKPAVERDRFAEMYRGAGAGFKLVVRSHLLGAAAEVVQAAPS